MLLKPWHNLRDLKGSLESWSDSYAQFLYVASSESLAIISGIQYMHECHDSKQDGEEPITSPKGSNKNLDDDDDDSEGIGLEPVGSTDPTTFDEQTLEAIIQAQTSLGEDLHGRFVIEVAKRRKIFENDVDQQNWQTHHESPFQVGNATGNDIQNLMNWCHQLESEISRMNVIQSGQGFGQNDAGTNSRVQLLEESISSIEPRVEQYERRMELGGIDGHLSATDPSCLNEDQRWAYDIIIWHLDQTIAGRNPPPLCMIVHGEGGTGKSKVLQTVTEAFRERGCERRLIKAAYTGITASLVDGKTTHSIASLSIKGGKFDADDAMSEEMKMKLKLERNWEPYDYLALDEMGMIAKDFFALLSRNISIGKKKTGDRLFGGINVILFGDFHQFPPVARPIRDALYYPSNTLTDSIGSQVG